MRLARKNTTNISKVTKYIFNLVSEIGFYLYCIYSICAPIARPIITKTLLWQDVFIVALILISAIFLIIPNSRKKIDRFINQEHQEYNLEGLIFLFAMFSIFLYSVLAIKPIFLK